VKVTVAHAGGDTYDVRIDERTRHAVTVPPAALERVQRDGESVESAVERVMQFLLRREPPESILSRFTFDDVARYFPEFWTEMAASRRTPG
jgi:hypothetical protein